MASSVSPARRHPAHAVFEVLRRLQQVAPFLQQFLPRCCQHDFRAVALEDLHAQVIFQLGHRIGNGGRHFMQLLLAGRRTIRGGRWRRRFAGLLRSVLTFDFFDDSTVDFPFFFPALAAYTLFIVQRGAEKDATAEPGNGPSKLSHIILTETEHTMLQIRHSEERAPPTMAGSIPTTAFPSAATTMPITWVLAPCW